MLAKSKMFRTTRALMWWIPLIILAVLQYRWSGQLSDAERERLRGSLMASMAQFRQHLNLEFQELTLRFEPGHATVLKGDWSSYAQLCEALLRQPQNQAAAGIYIWPPESAELLRLNPTARAFEPVSWPDALLLVRDRYMRLPPGVPPPEQRPLPFVAGSNMPFLIRPLPRFQPPPERGPMHGADSEREPPIGRDPRPTPWPGSEPAGPRAFGLLAIELSPEGLSQALFPELAEKYFSGTGGIAFQVAVVAQNPRRLIYVSEPGTTLQKFDTADARMTLWPGELRGGGHRPPRDFRFPGQAPPSPPPDYLAPAPQDRGTGWQLAARHPGGSLDAAVAALRRRNLAISLGMLALLAGSLALIVISARRAQRLARMQMDFVAGVSHELRTPLSVIRSAGDNLADGVVGSSLEQVKRYGELVRSEAARLAVTVERILQYGKLQHGRPGFALRPASLDDIAARALSALAPALKDAAFTVETGFAPNLPSVDVDVSLLSSCVHNLVENAIKYSGPRKWLAVRTAAAWTKGGAAVELIIEDRGPGIDPEDLPYIFDPFFRGRNAIAAQIHGTGLGLFMVRESVAAMQGTIAVKTNTESGTRFTLTFPAASTTGSPPGREPPEQSTLVRA